MQQIVELSAPTTLITTKGQEWLYKKLKKYLETGEAV